MSVARKEVNESLYWLRLVNGDLAEGAEIVALIREANELTAILTSSVKTAKARFRAKSPRLPELDDRTSEMKQPQVVRTDSFPSHESCAESVVPGVRPLDNPAARLTANASNQRPLAAPPEVRG